MPPASSAVDPWDDWESEDYGRGVGQSGQPDEASANARLWQVANNSLSFGPSPVTSRQANTNHNPYAYDSSSSTSSPAPPAAFVPSLKILKRPTNSPSSSSASSQAARDQQKKSLKDRERAYHEARNRIFGANSGSTPTSATPSGASSPVTGATSPSTTAAALTGDAQNLSASVEKLDLTYTRASSGKDISPGSSPALSSTNRSSNPGKPRVSRRSGADSPSQSTPVSSRPSTPASTILREPVNPPMSADKNSSATAQMQARGFSKTRKPKILSPAAMEFVPGSFVAKQETKPNKKQQQQQQQQQQQRKASNAPKQPEPATNVA